MIKSIITATIATVAASGVLSPLNERVEKRENEGVAQPVLKSKAQSGIANPDIHCSLKSDGTPNSEQIINDRTATSKSSYRGLSVGQQIDCPKWRVLGIERYYRYTIQSITTYNGVYDNLFGNYYEGEALASGAIEVSISNSSRLVQTIEQTISTSIEISFADTNSLRAAMSYEGLSGSAELTTKTTATYSESNIYTYSATRIYNSSETYKLGKEQGEACPDGYAVSIGHYGQYTSITVRRQLFVLWAWGVETREDNVFKLVDSNEPALAMGYIYRRASSVLPGC